MVDASAETPYISPLPPAIEDKRPPLVRLVPNIDETAATPLIGPKPVDDEWG